MKLRANRQNLKKYGPELLRGTTTTLKQLMDECLKGFTRDRYHHISFDERDHLERIDKLIGTHGVEGMLLDRRGNDVAGQCDESLVERDIHYCNTGDTYALTIMYVNHKLYIGDWGSIVERLN